VQVLPALQHHCLWYELDCAAQVVQCKEEERLSRVVGLQNCIHSVHTVVVLVHIWALVDDQRQKHEVQQYFLLSGAPHLSEIFDHKSPLKYVTYEMYVYDSCWHELHALHTLGRS